MSGINWFQVCDAFGVLVFAISGALAAGRRSMDVFGVLVIGFVTALGGGTLRDLLLGIQPIGWILNPYYLLLVTIAVFGALQWGKISHRFDERILIVSDAFGLAVFTVIGVQVAQQQPFVSPPVAIMMGVITGVAGGVIRDILCNEVPLIFRQEIYATASALGGVIYYLLDSLSLPELGTTLISMFSILIIRLIAIKARWTLPSFKLNT